MPCTVALRKVGQRILAAQAPVLIQMARDGVSLTTGKRSSSKKLVLTSRLVSPSGFSNALEELQEACTRYTAIIRRSVFSTEVAETDSVTIVFYEDEPLVKDGTIDSRLIRSKQVTLLITVRDGGTATLNLTSRVVNPIYASKELVQVVESFNDKLIEGARSRWTTAGSTLALVCLPILALLVVIFCDAAVDPRVEHALTNGNPKTPVPWDFWVAPSEVIIALSGIVFLAIAVGLSFIRLSSGSLRIWPEKMTRKSLVLGLRRIRISDSTHRNVATLIIGIVTGVVVAVIAHVI